MSRKKIGLCLLGFLLLTGASVYFIFPYLFPFLGANLGLYQPVQLDRLLETNPTAVFKTRTRPLNKESFASIKSIIETNEKNLKYVDQLEGEKK